MNSKVNIEKIGEIYGAETYEIILNNIDIIEKNLKYLEQLKFDDIAGIFERCPMIFTCFPNDFKKKINDLIKKIGEDYVGKIENDIGLLEKLL